MLELTETLIRKRADDLKITDLRLVELDIRLSDILRLIYSDPFLSERLYLKGGTAINKLYLRKTPRLSVDLDFNAIGERKEILEQRKEIRLKIIDLLKEQDPGYKITSKTKYQLIPVHAIFDPVFGGGPQHLKIEISNIERFPVLKPEKIELDGAWINTYSLEELTSTKLRALYSRLKGRDIYDLYFISDLYLNKPILRKLVLYYFYRSGKVFDPELFFRNIKEKFKSRKYVDDVSGFVRADIKFSLEIAVEKVLSSYNFLSDPDERDENFIALSKRLLDKPVSNERMEVISKIKHPLRYLFGDDARLSDRAGSFSIEESRIFLKPKK